MIRKTLLFSASLILLFAGCQSQKSKEMEKEFQTFISQFEKKYVPLTVEGNKAWYSAAVSGKKEDYKKAADLAVQQTKLFSDKEAFNKLKAFKKSGLIKDPLLKRQMDLLYLNFLGNQTDTTKLEELIREQSAIENKFAAFRTVANGKTLSDNQVDSILRSSTNSAELENVWTSSKLIGTQVAPQLITLVKKRNEVAKELGFANFQEMKLKLNEQNPKEVETLFDELDNLTRDAFKKAKGEIDAYLAKRFSIPADKLMPWHYQNRFFQEAPAIYNVDLDQFYKNVDICKVAETFYKGIGMPVDDIIKRSDLYEKPGKNQHAFSSDIDHSGDVRILVNLRNDSYWTNTILHELGHSVYAKYNDSKLPFLLRDAAHILTTEGIANMFGRFNANPDWIRDNLHISAEKAKSVAADCKNTNRLQQLIFSRWAQVMFRFEKGMYENPDQDLNKLWWDLVEKYQMLKRPQGRNQPDWASKIHIATVPCYYHNYLMGDLFASQVYYHITEKVLKSKNPDNESFTGKPEVGKFLIEQIFKPGARYTYDELLEKATGEKLTAKYYARQFVN
ncbi:MAG: M2 family metallopeptidase [Bacteroidota bacterium]|nr:M2 family metallopeptidase [Bacteroidota bacterium]